MEKILEEQSKKIQYYKVKIADIDFLLKEADEGKEVGDVFKLEMEKEKLENALRKTLIEVYGSVDNINVEGIEIQKVSKNDKMTNSKVKPNFKTTGKKMLKWYLIILILVSIGIAIGVNENNQKVKDTQEAVACYEYLLSDDDIKPECVAHFKDAQWYKDYLQEVSEYEANINK